MIVEDIIKIINKKDDDGSYITFKFDLTASIEDMDFYLKKVKSQYRKFVGDDPLRGIKEMMLKECINDVHTPSRKNLRFLNVAGMESIILFFHYKKFQSLDQFLRFLREKFIKAKKEAKQ